MCASSNPINLVVIYRFCELLPSLFLPEFYKFIDSIYIDFKNLVILGDFNIHVNQILNSSTVHFSDILSSFNLKQLVNGPTHKLGNTLDLIVANTDETDIHDINVDFNNSSDHAYIFFRIGVDLKVCKKKTIVTSNYKNINLPQFKADISAKIDNYVTTCDATSFCDALSDFNDVCNECVDSHLETKTIQVNIESRPKWMDHEFLNSRTERRRLYRVWKRSRTKEKSKVARKAFAEARKKTHLLSIEKRIHYHADLIDNCNSHSEVFNVCNSLLDKPKSSNLPTYTDPKAMADNFNNYFIEKVEKIRSSFGDQRSAAGTGIEPYNGVVMSEFKHVSPEELRKIMLSKPMKTSPQDPVPAFLLKPSVDELLPALELLVNLSLSSGSMKGLKESVITPILKKAGLDPEALKNYRPVCNIQYLSKLIERAVIIQSNHHMDSIGGHVSYQSGYKPQHSCETLLLRVTNDILVNSDEGKCTIKVLLDLSSAFDTVDHPGLLDIMWHDHGFRGTVYDWFADFLSERSQAVSIDGQNSDFKNNGYGVPQGSVVGPFLFNIYVGNLIKMLEKEGFTVHGYADDHQILYSFKIDFQAAAIRRTIPHCLDLIANWMKKHFLKLNPSKSQVIVFYPKSNSTQVVFDHLMLSDGSYIKISDKVHNLGALTDSTLSFSPHITSIISQGYRLIRGIAGVRKYLSVDHLKTLVHSIIVAKVDHCNSLFYGISSYDSNRLQKFQNSCARLIYGKKKYDHVSGILKELHWLPAEARTYFKILCCVWKCLHGLAPSYLTELIIISRPHTLTLRVPRSQSRSGDRAFSRAGPRLWNALPTDIRLIESLDRFKGQVKHLLFSSFTRFKLQVNVYRS